MTDVAKIFRSGGSEAVRLPKKYRFDGHEHRGTRPCVVISDPVVAEDQRYPMIAVVPITGRPGEGLLYPGLEPGPSGLRQPSFALVDQVRSVDKSHVIRVYSEIRKRELEALDEGLRGYLGLQAPPVTM